MDAKNKIKRDNAGEHFSIGSNRVTSNFYRGCCLVAIKIVSRLRWRIQGSMDGRLFVFARFETRLEEELEEREGERKGIEDEGKERKSCTYTRTTAPTGSTIPGGEKLRENTKGRRRREGREIPPTSTTTVAVRVLVIVHGWPLE